MIPSSSLVLDATSWSQTCRRAPPVFVKITWARLRGSATTDFAKLVNYFQLAGETAGSEARQPRPCGLLHEGRERNRAVAAVGAAANSSTGILSVQTDFDPSTSWRFLPTATGWSNSSTGFLRLGDASAALGPERHPLLRKVVRHLVYPCKGCLCSSQRCTPFLGREKDRCGGNCSAGGTCDEDRLAVVLA